MTLTDTPEHIHKKQLEVIFSKSPEERFLMGLQMTEGVRQIVINSIKIANPSMSESDLKIEFIRRYYEKELGTKYFNDVAAWIKTKVH